MIAVTGEIPAGGVAVTAMIVVAVEEAEAFVVTSVEAAVIAGEASRAKAEEDEATTMVVHSVRKWSHPQGSSSNSCRPRRALISLRSR